MHTTAHQLSILLCMCIATCGTALSQSADTAAPKPEMSRLQQLENTYQTRLRPLHAPVLNEYLRDLERLKQTLAAKDRAADLKHVDAEIARVKKMAATTGVFDYKLPKPDAPPALADKNGPSGKTIAGRFGADALVLPAGEATVKSGQGTAIMKDAPAKAILLGEATWKASRIAAGTYDLIAIAACAKSDEPRTITLKFNGKEITSPLTAAQVTGSNDNFRILRIGQITLDRDVTDAALTVQLDQPDKPILWVRSVVFARPKDKPPAK